MVTVQTLQLARSIALNTLYAEESQCEQGARESLEALAQIADYVERARYMISTAAQTWAWTRLKGVYDGLAVVEALDDFIEQVQQNPQDKTLRYEFLISRETYDCNSSSPSFDETKLLGVPKLLVHCLRIAEATITWAPNIGSHVRFEIC